MDMRQYGKYTQYDEKKDTLYILSDVILPNTRGMERKEHRKAYDEAWKMTYTERIERFAPDDAKREIAEQMQAHKGCIISEYCNA